MARGKKTGGRDFPAGNKANPKGGGALSPDIKKIRRLTTEEVHYVGSLVLSRDMETIDKIANDPKQPALRAWIAEIVASGHRGGNVNKFNALLDRLIGKVSDKVDITVKSPHANKSPEQIEQEIKELEELAAIKLNQEKKEG